MEFHRGFRVVVTMVRETEVMVGELMTVHTLRTKRIFSLKKKKKNEMPLESLITEVALFV